MPHRFRNTPASTAGHASAYVYSRVVDLFQDIYGLMRGLVKSESTEDVEVRRKIGTPAIKRWTELNPPLQESNETEERNQNCRTWVEQNIIICLMTQNFQVC